MLKIFILLFSLSALADQSEILLKGRAVYIKDAQGILKSYCKEGDPYLCLLQMKADCSHGKDIKKKHGCDSLLKVDALEKKILAVDKTISELELKEPAPPIVETLPPVVIPPDVKVSEAWKQLKVTMGSSPSSDKGGREDYKALKDLQDKINSHKVRIDCVTAADCAIQEFGKAMCGGPAGTFVYSVRGNHGDLINSINAYNKFDEEFQKKWNRDMYGSCVYLGRSEPTKCELNQCK